MRRIAVAIALVGCRSDDRATKGSSGSAEGQPSAAQRRAITPPPLGDLDTGTFVGSDRSKETFKLSRVPTGWQLVLDTTDGLNNFHYELNYDDHQRFTGGNEANSPKTDPPSTAKSTLTRDADGYIVEKGVYLSGYEYEARSKQPVDWYVRGAATWFAACLLDGAATRQIHPRGIVQIDAPQPFPTPDETRSLTRRTAQWPSGGQLTVIICEGERLVGVGRIGQQVVRDGDAILTTALAKLPELQPEPIKDLLPPPE